MKSLREAAKNGDERAIKIIKMQADGNDFDADFDAYFAPKPKIEEKAEFKATELEKTAAVDSVEKKTGLAKFLEFNGVKEGDADYEETVKAYYDEFPNQKPAEPEQKHVEGEERMFLDFLIDDEIEAIEAYGKAIIDVMNLEDETDSSRKGMISELEEIKRDEMDHLDKLRRMKSSIKEKEEPSSTQEENNL
jgi:hypothetical protein